jgi:hypothetical protein
MADTPRYVLSRFTRQPCRLTRGTVEVVVDVEDAAALAETKLAQVLSSLAACAVSGPPGKVGGEDAGLA